MCVGLLIFLVLAKKNYFRMLFCCRRPRLVLLSKLVSDFLTAGTCFFFVCEDMLHIVARSFVLGLSKKIHDFSAFRVCVRKRASARRGEGEIGGGGEGESRAGSKGKGVSLQNRERDFC